MTDFIVYLLKSGIALSIFFLLYIVFLRKETFYTFNRFYLLVTLIISFILPFINIEFSRSPGQFVNNFEFVEHALLEASETLESVELKTVENVQSFPMIGFLLVVGMIITAMRIGYQLFCIYKNVKTYELKTKEKYKYVLMDKNHSTHSFFNFIFVQKSAYKNGQIEEMLLHEYVHADKLHSLDLLIIGFLSILQWFNPFIYLFKRALTETHEFQADRALLDSGADKVRYQQLLLDQARSIVFAGLTSNFNQSLIKNRLKMMNKIKSGNGVMIKYLMIIPIVFVISIAFAISQEKIEDSISELVINSKDGPITGTSGMVELNFTSTPDRMDTNGGMYYDSETEKTVFLGDEVIGSTEKGTFSVKADNIIYYNNERRIIGFSDDYIPSILPIDNKYLKRIASGFGMRIHPITKENKMHNGVDLSANTGTPVMATADGNIRLSELRKDYGNRVIIDHGNGYSTSYSQLQRFIVEKGKSVEKGEVIGYVGSTGMSTAPHLHYEVMKDGKYINPANYFSLTTE